MLAAEQVIGRPAVLDIVHTVIAADMTFTSDFAVLLAARRQLLLAASAGNFTHP